MPEGMILDEATTLDSIGPLWVWGQVARCAAEDRPAASLVAAWEKQAEYGYWTKLINETLRFERSRSLARQRCAAVEAHLVLLRDQLTSSDRHAAPALD